MDRSFLSRAEVVAASRSFVCVRLTTYEDDAEAKFLRGLFIGRSGDVENTTFSILAPDGKERLVRTGRSAKAVFTDAIDMARSMSAIAKTYPAKGDDQTPPLPVTGDVRLGLDVAASDNQPLLVVVGADGKARTALEAKVAKLAWSEPFLGRFVYASGMAKELATVEGLQPESALVLIEPDTFGQKGTVVRQLAANATPEDLAAAMKATLAAHMRVVKESRSHTRAGVQAGAFWEPKLPVTDREEANARARTKQAIDRQK